MPFLFAYGINRFSHHSLCYPGTNEPLYNTIRYNTVLVLIGINTGPQMTS